MTGEGIEKLIGYQRSYFAREWRYNMKAGELAEVMEAYADALEDFEDDAVLRGYLSSLRGWEKMPSVAQIMTAADGIARKMVEERGADGYRCTVCDLPWRGGSGYGRDEGRRRGQIRCPNCNAILESASDLIGRRADGISF